MPLTRANVTAASRIMLPAYPVFFGVTGLNFLAHPPRLDEVPALAFAARFMPLPSWGLLFIGCAALMVAAFVTRSRMMFRYALLVCAVSEALFAAGFVLGAFQSNVSASAWAWPAFVVTACIASERSLFTAERTT